MHHKKPPPSFPNVRILVTLSVAQQNNEQGRTYEPKDWMIVIGGHPITLVRRKLHSALAMTGRGTRFVIDGHGQE